MTAITAHRALSPRHWLLVLATLSLLAFVVPWLDSHLVAITTPSVKYRLAWLSDGPGSKGDYVNVNVTNAYIRGGHEQTLTKRMACVAGDTLTFDGSYHYCNGVRLGQVLTMDSKHQRLLAFVWNGQVPAGKVFVMGDHPNSFDSRYFGFLDIRSTRRVVGLI
jgi:conjugal transfer pilin signal peptidase TrbI